MALVIIKGLTMAQAKAFASWYDNQGEQDADYWFAENCEDDTPMITQYIIDEECEIVTMYMKNFNAR